MEKSSFVSGTPRKAPEPFGEVLDESPASFKGFLTERDTSKIQSANTVGWQPMPKNNPGEQFSIFYAIKLGMWQDVVLQIGMSVSGSKADR